MSNRRREVDAHGRTPAMRVNSLATRWAIVFVAATVMLAACQTVGPNFKSPDAPKVADYAMAGDSAPAIARLSPDTRTAGPWWTALGSPDLDNVMDQALAGNQTVAAADADLEKSMAEAGAARGALDPRLDLASNAARERINFQTFGFPNIPNPTLNVYNIGGTVSYDLDLFGGGRRTLEAARATAESEKWRADAAYLALTGNVALQAVRMAGLRAEIDAIAEIIADDKHDLDLIHAAEAAGGEPASATTGGRAQLAADETLLPAVQRDLAAARHALSALVGKSPAEWEPPDFAFAGFAPPDQIPIALPSNLVRNRPDILAAEAMLHADTARIGVALANLYPDVRLSGNLTQGAVTPGNLFIYNSTGWMVGPSLSAPLLNGGALRAQKRAAEAQARASLAQYRQTVLTAFAQVADVLTALAHDDDQLSAVDDAQSAAQAALDDARTALRLGGGTMLDLVEAQRRLDRARLQKVQAQGRRLLDIVTLFTATAADWRSKAAPVAATPTTAFGASKAPAGA
jgi:NodT family efflux transporter outer membrane factor (OMF) lipoprotein